MAYIEAKKIRVILGVHSEPTPKSSLPNDTDSFVVEGIFSDEKLNKKQLRGGFEHNPPQLNLIQESARAKDIPVARAEMQAVDEREIARLLQTPPPSLMYAQVLPGVLQYFDKVCAKEGRISLVEQLRLQWIIKYFFNRNETGIDHLRNLSMAQMALDLQRHLNEGEKPSKKTVVIAGIMHLGIINGLRMREVERLAKIQAHPHRGKYHKQQTGYYLTQDAEGKVTSEHYFPTKLSL